MSESFTYKDAGVDIHEAAALVGDIGELRQRTEKKRQLFQPFGLFAASYDLSAYKEPVIVTGADGVGTKLRLLLDHDELEIAGKDLVAMNVNDILTTGGDPLMFLDYIGIGKIDKTQIKRIIAGICEWCEACDCILGGGETAEMPDLVAPDMIELSGFCVGAAEKADLIDLQGIGAGDVLIGWASDGFHANGWSLVRRILAAFPDELSKDELHQLLAPTRLYYDVVTDLRAKGVKPKGMAHITGGGLPENLARLLGGHGASISIPEWQNVAVAKVLSHVETQEAVNTFNMGFGWVAIVSSDQVEAATAAGAGGVVIGELSAKGGEVTVKVGG
ncbi:MAG: phosphoribosylformylglycinamidine cyclo-ligase [Verrucomicrobiales bacterium]|jgi:phosphoribosylformylglycinamidine cyclo-ligase